MSEETRQASLEEVLERVVARTPRGWIAAFTEGGSTAALPPSVERGAHRDDLDGDAIVRALRGAGDEIPIVVVTGIAAQEAIDRVGDHRITVLSKPYERDELVRALGRAIADRAA